MDIQVSVTNITHDNLVDLFSTAGCGSQWLVLRACAAARKYKKEDDCHEDILAKALLNGLTIEAFDYNAEGEVYGDLPHTHEEDDNDCVHYTINLHDIEKGIAKCLTGDKRWDDDTNHYLRKCATHLMEDECINLDKSEAEAVMEVIMFGEWIYG